LAVLRAIAVASVIESGFRATAHHRAARQQASKSDTEFHGIGVIAHRAETTARSQ
jgi:hypothetical protein